MDPFSIVASTIAVIQIADRIATLCKEYITGVRDAPTDLRTILIEVGSVKCLLEVIQLMDEDSVEILSKIQGPIEGCKQAFKSLEDLFPSRSPESSRSKRQRVGVSLVSLAWPFKRDKALKLLDEIGKYKATISLALTAESSQDLKHIRRNIDRIRETTTEFEMNQISKWLVTIDPSSNHNSACALYEEHTGQWLTRSAEYVEWKAGRSQFLWLHGIPGAGKTVLHSYITEDVKSFYKENKSEYAACAYYYCYFGHGKDEAPAFLRWIISQLCRQIEGIPEEIRQMFKAGGEPKTQDLIHGLYGVARNFSRVYIIIDALDEAPDRQMLLQTLRELLAVKPDDEYNRLQLLATSREERDITEELKTLGKNLSLTNEYVDQDIGTYVQSRLQAKSKFRHWPNDLKHETELALVAEAKGMFRWAFCQLDALKRCCTIAEVKFALTQLPETLDETYERILCNIIPQRHDMVYKILNLLAMQPQIEYLTLKMVSDFIAIDLETPSFDPKNTPLDPHAPIEVCTCLLTYDVDEDILKFAHYTVKEFLMSSRISSGPAKSFCMTNDSTQSLVASHFIVYLLYRNYDDEHKEEPHLAENAIMWPECVEIIDSKSVKIAMSPLLIRLLDPTQPHYLSLIHLLKEKEGMQPYDNVFRLASDCDQTFGILWNLCMFNQIEAAEVFLSSRNEPLDFNTFSKLADDYWLWSLRTYSKENRPISQLQEKIVEYFKLMEEGETGDTIVSLPQIALHQENMQFLKLFVENGADVNLLSPTGLSLLTTVLSPQILCSRELVVHSQSWNSCLEFVDLLVYYKANPSAPGCILSPLQALMGVLGATRNYVRREWSSVAVLRIVHSLLERGADVNGVGCDATNIKRIEWTSKCYLEEAGILGSEFGSQLTAKTLYTRGHSYFYDTPLRILEKRKDRICRYGDIHTQDLVQRLEAMLKRYGGKSLHLFPIEGLPGYDEEDMREWNMMKKSTMQTPSIASSSTTSPDIQ